MANKTILSFVRFTAQPSDKQWTQVTLALYRADYHGAELEVTRTKCSSLRGIRGIVLMDTKNTFKVISRDNVIRSKYVAKHFPEHLQEFYPPDFLNFFFFFSYSKITLHV